MSSPRCFESPATTSPTCEAGKAEQLAGLKTYYTGRPESKNAILIVSDAMGYEAPTLRKLADKVAGAGFFVVVPDFLYGEPADLSNPQFDREAWRKVHTTEKRYKDAKEDAKQVISALKDKGFSSIGAAGFCWGGVVVTKLASSTDLKAAVVLHPGRLTDDDINAVKVPISLLGAEIDQYSPAEELKQFGEILAAKNEFDYFVKIFPGVSHGWTMRYNAEDESAVKSAEEAHGDMLDWFIKYVK